MLGVGSLKEPLHGTAPHRVGWDAGGWRCSAVGASPAGCRDRDSSVMSTCGAGLKIPKAEPWGSVSQFSREELAPTVREQVC